MKQKSFERKDEVIQAALDEFTSKNYEQASLNKIIKSAKISKGTFYYHFENKEALYIFLLKESVDLKWNYISNNSNEQIEFLKYDIFEKFLYQAKQGIEFGRLYPKYNALAKMFARESNEPIYNIAKDQLNAGSHNILTPMIKEAIENGELNSSFDMEFIVNTLTYLFKSFDDILDTSKGSSSTVEQLDKFIEFMKYGFINNRN